MPSSSDDPSRYRDESVTAVWREARCPSLASAALLGRGLLTTESDAALREELDAEVRATIAAQESIGPPALDTLVRDVFARCRKTSLNSSPKSPPLFRISPPTKRVSAPPHSQNLSANPRIGISPPSALPGPPWAHTWRPCNDPPFVDPQSFRCRDPAGSAGCFSHYRPSYSMANVQAKPPSLMVAQKIQRPLYLVLDAGRVPDSWDMKEASSMNPTSGPQFKLQDFQKFVTRDLKDAMGAYFSRVEVVKAGDPLPTEPHVVGTSRSTACSYTASRPGVWSTPSSR